MLYFIIYLLLTIGSWVAYQKFLRRDLPPGPVPWPLIGNIIEFAMSGRTMPEAFDLLSKKYGNIYSITLGGHSSVVVNGSSAIRSLTKTEDFDNRIWEAWMVGRSNGKKLGLLMSESAIWKDTRLVSVRILKNLGFMKPSILERVIQVELDEFVQYLRIKVKGNESVIVDSMFYGTMANVIWTFVTGSRYDLDNPHFQKLLAASSYESGRYGVGGYRLFDAFPLIAKLFKERSGFGALDLANDFIKKSFQETVNIHRERGDYKTNPTPANFLDLFLAEMEKHNNKDSDSICETYTDENLVCTMKDLFFVGSETSASSLAYAVRYLIQHPGVQTKVRAEIDSVIGNRRIAKFEDKSRLRYTDATIMEILRSANPALVGPRRAVDSKCYQQYKIPKDTIVLLNYHSAQMDEAVWGDPQNFRPERFLNENGDIINSEKLNSILFGAGKRNCFGEVAARVSLFVGLTTLIQNFIFEVDPLSGVPDSRSHYGITSCPTAFKMRVKTRN